jgi:hypothetical protein
MGNRLADLRGLSLIVKRESNKVTFASIIFPMVGSG